MRGDVLITASLGRRDISDAEVCRRLGWKPGDYIEGDEGFGPDVYRITAIGEEGMLARCVLRDGKRVECNENSLTLMCRDWHKVDPPGVLL